ncbi:hypothetical protein M422DRAFT_33111, partial [Sphaerobolus stellatus SS14]
VRPPDVTHIDEPALARERKLKFLLALVGRKFLLDSDKQPPLSGRVLRVDVAIGSLAGMRRA